MAAKVGLRDGQLSPGSDMEECSYGRTTGMVQKDGLPARTHGFVHSREEQGRVGVGFQPVEGPHRGQLRKLSFRKRSLDVETLPDERCTNRGNRLRRRDVGGVGRDKPEETRIHLNVLSLDRTRRIGTLADNLH